MSERAGKTPPPPQPSTPPDAPALGSVPFRRFLAANALSLPGTFLQSVAMSWLVYRLTRSELMLGLVGFLGELPGVAVALFAGVLADRVSPHRILLVTRASAMLQALALAALVLAERESIAVVLVLACLLGFVNGFDVPARQLLMARMLRGRTALEQGITLYSFVYDAARLTGSALGGILIRAYGEGVCFLANAVGYAGVLVVLATMKLAPVATAAKRPAVMATLGAGLRHARRSPRILAILLLVAAAAFFAGGQTVLLPVMASTVLAGGPGTLGTLTASIGVGALVGVPVRLALIRWRVARASLLVAGAGLFGLGLAAFACSRWLWLSAPLLAVAGLGAMLLMNSAHATLLDVSERSKQGRVMSLFTLAFMSATPAGSLLSGLVASRFGAPLTITIGGTLCAGAALVFASFVRSRGTAPDRAW